MLSFDDVHPYPHEELADGYSEGDALVWLIDFELKDPRRVLSGTGWVVPLKAARQKLLDEGFKNPYRDDHPDLV